MQASRWFPAHQHKPGLNAHPLRNARFKGIAGHAVDEMTDGMQPYSEKADTSSGSMKEIKFLEGDAGEAGDDIVLAGQSDDEGDLSDCDPSGLVHPDLDIPSAYESGRLLMSLSSHLLPQKERTMVPTRYPMVQTNSVVGTEDRILVLPHHFARGRGSAVKNPYFSTPTQTYRPNRHRGWDCRDGVND